jgi:hypothetical protein
MRYKQAGSPQRFPLNFYSDDGHGWLRVPLHVVSAMGLADKISAYSYRDERFAYLEEDCDMTKFCEAFKQAHAIEPVINIVRCRGESSIRRKARFV